VRRGGEHATLDLLTGEVLAGELPPRVLRAVRKVLEAHREEALAAFQAALGHRSPGMLERGPEERGDE
jgi:hypothetical protein